MKARVKATGEIVEIYLYGKEGYDYVCDDKEEVYERSELEILDDPDYWTRLEHQYAGMAMQGLCANSIFMKDHEDCYQCNEEMIAIYAYDIATALVQKLKEEEERK